MADVVTNLQVGGTAIDAATSVATGVGLSGAAQATTQSGPPSAAGTVAQAVGEAAQAAPIDAAFSWTGYFQAIAVLMFLLAVLWGVVWLVRRYGKFNFLPQPGALPRDALRLEAQLPLGPRRSLVVVRFLNKRLLLGVTDTQINLLQEVGNHDESDSVVFQDVMEEVGRQKTGA